MLNIVTYFTARYKTVPSSLVLPKLKFLINPYILESLDQKQVSVGRKLQLLCVNPRMNFKESLRNS